MDFEKQMKELEEIIAKLDGNQVTLNEGIMLFEKGSQLIKEASKTLKEAKGKITVIKNALEEDFKD
ncbi:MAG: exodeoxyribonuclease VII small subunit [Christensenellales bacterium]|jgi:exodeoxyribonuclease VII small subunit